MNNIGKKSLVSVVGVSAASILLYIVPGFEGNVSHGYNDPGGIPTKCFGDTHDVVVGKSYSKEECLESLETQLISHSEKVLQCTPDLKGHPYQLAAAVSFAYNIGADAYCSSTTARRFNNHDYTGACRAINQDDEGHLQWVTSNGKVLPGLVKRRAEEREICERDIPPS